MNACIGRLSGRARQALARQGGQYARDRRGTAALEFALIAGPLLFLLIGCFEIAYDYFAQAALDYGVQQAARAVQIGAAQGLTSAADFKTSFLCNKAINALPALLNCDNVTVSVQSVPTDFYTNPLSNPVDPKTGKVVPNTAFCPGLPGQLMQVQAVYDGPVFVFGLVPALSANNGGQSVHVTVSTAAFVNEPFTPSASQPAGC